ncbi:hypothetical protein PEX1_078670 [Penicillium expansum]|uniref:Uncharacterized protein n=1 Tax=Penicillium expansum TaxID=27334 RepID=A0A0A2KVC6_PENEN|nr:hypothetical protein PEX2_096150 [Penicillium expansum]KGO44197.1 hypothetical protein PEXP_056900 [Penicillium expansum]KGO51070.1 hypothetical protein PEX2_096150 [Penicillium expansum]KGO68325.1 hypothetical protein PEX1_078670 [Penicillium expansum]
MRGEKLDSFPIGTLQFIFQRSGHKDRDMDIHYSVSEYNATYNRDAHIPRHAQRFFGCMKRGYEGNQKG